MTKKKLNTLIDNLFHKYGEGKQYKIMDLSKITKAGEAAHINGGDIEQAVKAACEALAL
jgi:hypothetical protein